MFWRIRKRLGMVRELTRQESNERRIENLRSAGMKIGTRVGIVNCTLDTMYPFLIEIGSDVLMTHATILAHDASPVVFGPQTRVGKVKILDQCFIGAGAVVLPGVTIGPRAIVGANTVVARDVPAGSVFAGNPGKVVGDVDSWLSKKEAEGELIPWSGGIVPTNEHVEAARMAAKKKFGIFIATPRG